MGNLYIATGGEWDMTSIPEDKHQEYFAKCEEYTKYINTHCENVVRAYLNIFVNKEYPEIVGYNEKEISKEEWRQAWHSIVRDIYEHDASKYEDDEFHPYRNHFYPMEGEEQKEEAFQEAWKHHYTVNDHHPEHWVNETGDPVNMPLPQIIHMLCDWASFEVAGNGDSFVFHKERFVEFWEKQKASVERKKYTEETIGLIDRIIEVL